MLTANLPIRPTPQFSGGIGGTLPTSPYPYELKYAFYHSVRDIAELVPMVMSVWGVNSKEATDQLKELDALIRTLGDPDTKIFFYRSEQGIESNYRVCFDNPKFNHDLDPVGHWNQHKKNEEKKLFPEETEILKLKEVQNLLVRFRDAVHQVHGEERLKQAEQLLPELADNLHRILIRS